jgi:hypothetical protein
MNWKDSPVLASRKKLLDSDRNGERTFAALTNQSSLV